MVDYILTIFEELELEGVYLDENARSNLIEDIVVLKENGKISRKVYGCLKYVLENYNKIKVA